MYTFIISILLLVLGYVFYGYFVERTFGADPRRETPCYTKQDGVDYIPMPTWKVYLIQFLNIASSAPFRAYSSAPPPTFGSSSAASSAEPYTTT